MMAGASPNQAAIFTALGGVLASYPLVPAAGCPIVRGQVNRVPPPKSSDFIVIWPINVTRLSENTVTPIDNLFSGYCAMNVLTVQQILRGSVIPGVRLSFPGIVSPPIIGPQLSGPVGGVGTYSLQFNPFDSRTLTAGFLTHIQSVDMAVQVDIHGPSSAENAFVVGNLWRDWFTVDALRSSGISPLWSDTSRQLAFEDEAKQTQERWSVDLHMQVSPMVLTGMQFSESLHATTTPIDLLAPIAPVQES